MDPVTTTRVPPPRPPGRRGFGRRSGLAAGRAAVAGAACGFGGAGGGPPAAAGRGGSGAAPPTGTPVRGGTLTVAIGADLDTLDPLKYFTSVAGVVFRNLTDTLLRFAEDLRPVPGLARSWDVSPDGRRYTFHLQPGVTFHDGTPFDAEAVRFTFARYVEDASSPWHQDVADVQEVAAVDPLTVRVTL